MHIWPNGNTYMCCVTTADKKIGVLSETESLRDLWNSERIRKNRLLMLKDEPVLDCSRCYAIEATGGISQRMDQNRNFVHHMPIVDTTQVDGTVEKLNMPYMDIRFSNVCNLRCRTCGPELSSRWAADMDKLRGIEVNDSKGGILRPLKDEDALWDQLYELLPSVERIYFAGGEPMLMEEHYRILKLLIAEGRTDVQLTYNTNFTVHKYKGLDVFELWKYFPNVTVGASLDESSARAEYIRKETNWQDILFNRKAMQETCPHVNFYINMTLSVFNFSTAANFHREMVETGFIKDHEFHINLLTYPTWYKVHITPVEYRLSIIASYEEHIRWLHRHTTYPNQTLLSDWQSAIKYLDGPQDKEMLTYFKQLTISLDAIRNESLSEALPELTFLLSDHE